MSIQKRFKIKRQQKLKRRAARRKLKEKGVDLSTVYYDKYYLKKEKEHNRG